MYPNYCCPTSNYDCCAPRNCCSTSNACCLPASNACCVSMPNCCSVRNYCSSPIRRLAPLSAVGLGASSSATTPLKRKKPSRTTKRLKSVKDKNKEEEKLKNAASKSRCLDEKKSQTCLDKLKCMREVECRESQDDVKLKSSLRSLCRSSACIMRNVREKECENPPAPPKKEICCCTKRCSSVTGSEGGEVCTIKSCKHLRGQQASTENIKMGHSEKSLRSHSLHSITDKQLRTSPRGKVPSARSPRRSTKVHDQASDIQFHSSPSRSSGRGRARTQQRYFSDEDSYTSLRHSSPKQLKNKKNYEYQDRNMRGPMEAIAEEEEDACPIDCPGPEECLTSARNNIQDTCADFLNIVNDTVLDTVQKSVECILQQYFCQTIERIDSLCAHLMRNDCMISKMYIDLMEKMCQQNEKSQMQFKCLCEFLIESRREAPAAPPSPTAYSRCFEGLNMDLSKYSAGFPPSAERMPTFKSCDCHTCPNNAKPEALSEHSVEVLQKSSSRQRAGLSRKPKVDASCMTDSSYSQKVFRYPSPVNFFCPDQICSLTSNTRAKSPKRSSRSTTPNKIPSHELHKPHSDLQLRITLSKNLKPRNNRSDSSISMQ